MARKKVKLVWIANDSARKASFKKRRQGLLKKVRELSTLCGVDAFAIVYSPDVKEPAFWPARPALHRLLSTYQSLPDMDRYKKMTNQETYLKERVTKVQQQLKAQQKKTRELEMAWLMYRVSREGKGIDELAVAELQGLIWLIEMRVKEMRDRLSYLRHVSLPMEKQPTAPHPHPPSAATENAHVPVNGPTRERLMCDQWSMEMMMMIMMMMKSNGNMNMMSGTGWIDNAMIGNHPYPESSIGGNRNELGAPWCHLWDRSFIAANDRTGYVQSDLGTRGYTSMHLVDGSAGGGGWGLQPHGHASDGTELGLPFLSFRGSGCAGTGPGLPDDAT